MFRLAGVSQQRTPAICALSRRSPLLRDSDKATKFFLSGILDYKACIFLTKIPDKFWSLC